MDDFQQVEKVTDRLVVRAARKADYVSWHAGYSGRLPSLNRHDEGRMEMAMCTEAWFAELVEKYGRLAEADEAYVFEVFLKADGAHIGTVDFSTLARDAFQWGRLGYTLHNQYWDSGYGTEAVSGALELAFSALGYHRIEAHINTDNPASVRLAEKAGLTFECVRKGFIFEHGEWTDHLIYVKTAGE